MHKEKEQYVLFRYTVCERLVQLDKEAVQLFLYYS